MKSKRIAKITSFLLAIIMLAASLPLTGISALAYTQHTRSEAVQWANSMIGKSIDYDGVYNAQCVDLIKAYYNYLGVAPVSGNGNDYATNSLPSGWTRIKYYNGFVAQPGDIAVWTYLANSYGHVAIVTSADSYGMNTVNQGATWNYKTVSSYYAYSKGTFYGVIRPDFPSEVATYTVSYNANGGAGEPSAQTKYSDRDLILSSGIPYRNGYNFIGWSESPNASSPAYYPNGTFNENRNITLYAVWHKISYTIYYDANGGNNAPSQQTKYYDENLNLSFAIPTRGGYIFLGWSESPNASSPTYYPGDVFNENKSTTFYAVWEKSAYTIKYYTNGGSGEPESQTKYFDEDIVISDQIPTKDGFVFQGWYDGSLVYFPGDNYSENKNVNFEAIWAQIDYDVLSDGTIRIEKFDNTGFYSIDIKTVYIPETIDGKIVSELGSNSIYCYNAETIVVPDSITVIGDSAFTSCYNLTNIAIPSSVTSIGDYAFCGCKSLKNITIPDSVTSIGFSAFKGTEYYNDDANWEKGVLYIGNHLIAANSDEIPLEYSINEGTVTIADFAFVECYNLTSVTIPNSVTNIGVCAFNECYDLVSIEIPDSVISIGDWAFSYCKNLTSITLSKNLNCIEDYTFSHCRNLKNISIPNSIKSIEEGAFEGCDNLSYIILPESVSYIGCYAFGETSIERVYIYNKDCEIHDDIYDELGDYYNTFPKYCTTIYGYEGSTANFYAEKFGQYFIPFIPGDFGYNELFDGEINIIDYTGSDAVINIPSEIEKQPVTSIGYLAFFDYIILESVIIPDSVTYIDESAFSYCENLSTVKLGNNVTGIGPWAFENCTSLTSITIPKSVEYIDEDAFVGSALETIYGYENSYAQTYAEENGYKFVPLYTYENEESGITVDADKSELPEDTELVVTVKEETENSVTYDISLQSGGAEVQPTGSVTVKIPVPETMDGKSIKVYRKEADGTMTDMNAVYKDGFMVFTTEHFSEYVLKEEESTVKSEPGDVNGDGKINALDVLIVKRYIAKYDDAKLEGDMFALADVSGDGKVNAKDALAIMQKIAKLITSFDEIK